MDDQKYSGQPGENNIFLNKLKKYVIPLRRDKRTLLEISKKMILWSKNGT